MVSQTRRHCNARKMHTQATLFYSCTGVSQFPQRLFEGHTGVSLDVVDNIDTYGPKEPFRRGVGEGGPETNQR
jgi:hypothetical protein